MVSAYKPTPHGAELTKFGVDYCLWTPNSREVSVIINRTGDRGTCDFKLGKEKGGWFSGHDPEGKAGDLYFFRLDGSKDVPDVASRYQPEGVKGPSQIIDSSSFKWRVLHWRRPTMEELVIYELHVGTFTEEGTFSSAISRLNYLKDLGVTAIELMPVAAFPGGRNWGYDVVLPFAPADCYGKPDDLRRLVDAAHERDLAVLLDVVYNHVCGQPNWLEATTPFYFHEDGKNEWGKCLNFDGEHSAAVRQYFLQNAAYWMDEFHVDGFRLDAIHAIRDSSSVHILQEIAQSVHARNGLVIGEDNGNDASRIRSVHQGGMGLDGVWADDFHHAVKMSVKPEQIAHFKSYRGTAAELVETVENGWLFRGQMFPYTGKLRGTECKDLSPAQFIYCISNHDQVGNRPLGERLHQLVSPEAYRAASMLLLLCPYTPMLFMGQEWATTSPFVFFSDHGGDFGACVRGGRCEEFKQFGAAWPAEALATMPDPEEKESFSASKLNWQEIGEHLHSPVLALYQECLRLRKEDPVIRLRKRESWKVWTTGEVTWLKYGDEAGDSRLLAVYLRNEPIPQLPWPESVSWDKGWSIVLSTEEVRFGGKGAKMFDPASRTFSFSGPAALLFSSVL